MTNWRETERHERLWVQVEPCLPPGEIAHDALHIERVYRWALKLAAEHGVSRELAGAAALVHDLVPIPKDSVDRPLGGEKSALAAGPVLSVAGYDADDVAAVVDAVRTSSWSAGHAPRSPLGALLQDADRLDAIGVIGAARCFATAQFMSKPDRPGRLYDPADPFAESGRALDDRRQAVDHFERKLLKLAASMHSDLARREAAKRQTSMLTLLAALRDELSAD
jgi:uncharacterized protein